MRHLRGNLQHVWQRIEERCQTRRAREWWREAVEFLAGADLSDPFFSGEMYLRGGPDGSVLVVEGGVVRTFLGPELRTSKEPRDFGYVRDILLRKERVSSGQTRRGEACGPKLSHKAAVEVMGRFDEAGFSLVIVDVLCSEAGCSRELVERLIGVGVLVKEPYDQVSLAPAWVRSARG